MEKYFLLYFTFYLISFYSTYYHLNYLNKHIEINEYDTLPDLLIESLPDLSNVKICNFMIDSFILILFIPFFIKKRYDLLYFMFKIISILTLLRSVTKLVTIVPSQNNNCSNNSSIKTYLTGYCNDKIFSGHTAITLILILTIMENKLINNNYNSLLVFSHIFYAFLILATRNHYSVDVVLGYIITYSVFNNLKEVLI